MNILASYQPAFLHLFSTFLSQLYFSCVNKWINPACARKDRKGGITGLVVTHLLTVTQFQTKLPIFRFIFPFYYFMFMLFSPNLVNANSKQLVGETYHSSKTGEASHCVYPNYCTCYNMSQGSWIHKALAGLFFIHELTDSYSWLACLWLTGERESNGISPTNISSLVLLASWPLWHYWDSNLCSNVHIAKVFCFCCCCATQEAAIISLF